MNKYKVGDKFIVEIEEVQEHIDLVDGRCDAYIFKNLSGIMFREGTLDKFHKVDSKMKIESIDDMIAEYDTEKKGYNRGLQDVWELMKKAVLPTGNGGLKSQDLKYIFDVPMGKTVSCWVLGNYTPQEALARLEAYEKEQAEIKVGDVVVSCDEDAHRFVVAYISDAGYYCGILADGSWYSSRKVEKTGKCIDIQAVLQEIGGES